MADRSCVLCGDEETKDNTNIALPCYDHWACRDCLPTYFTNAAENESQYPPRCCDELLMLEQYLDYLPQNVLDKFLPKQEEYSVLARSRIYCAKSSCAKFLHPNVHKSDAATNRCYAICDFGGCESITCVNCKSLISGGVQSHTCEMRAEEQKFKEIAEKEGYQTCTLCTRVIELTEACNHMTCECGYSFCYVCGKQWEGLHGCPQYGAAQYDEDGYNQEGFHRETGQNRDGRTRREQILFAGEQDEVDPDDEEEEDEEDTDEEWEVSDEDVLQHVDDETRAVIIGLPHHEREDQLLHLRIHLFETQGSIFPDPSQRQDEDEDDLDDEDREEDDQAQGGRDDNDDEDHREHDHNENEQPNRDDEGALLEDDRPDSASITPGEPGALEFAIGNDLGVSVGDPLGPQLFGGAGVGALDDTIHRGLLAYDVDLGYDEHMSLELENSPGGKFTTGGHEGDDIRDISQVGEGSLEPGVGSPLEDHMPHIDDEDDPLAQSLD